MVLAHSSTRCGKGISHSTAQAISSRYADVGAGTASKATRRSRTERVLSQYRCKTANGDHIDHTAELNYTDQSAASHKTQH
eukprot:11967-Heterococcus_DN1.PRE.2